jgi:hypothetical protein
VVFFGTAGTIAFGIGLYESHVNHGTFHLHHHAFHGGDVFLVLMAGVLLILIAIGYLLFDIASGHEAAEAEPEDRPADEVDDDDDEESLPGPLIILIDRTIRLEEEPNYEAEVNGSYDLEDDGKMRYNISVTGESADEVASTTQSLLETVLKDGEN